MWRNRSWRVGGRCFSSVAEGSSGSLMKTELQDISVSSSTFQKIRQNGLVYVDKTHYLPQLLSPTAQIFLSRPRKFGKSTLLSTIQSVFMDNGPEKKKLFDGLWVAENSPTLLEKELPVLSLDFSTLNLEEGGQELKKSLLQKLHEIAQVNDITLDGLDLPNSVARLVRKLSETKKENKVVLLIDEYDAPLTRVLAMDRDNKRAIENREVLHGFFATLKGLDTYIHFQMVTGVSKFARTSLFSGANQLRDITLSPAFSSLLGYTKPEIQTAFKLHLEALAKEEGLDQDQLWERITTWYNGYSWGGREKVYNPYSIGMLFTDMCWEGFWMNTGTPGWLLRLLKPDDLKGMPSELGEFRPLSDFVKFELESLGRSSFDTVSLLFQTGYLTIKEEKKEEDGSRSIRLDYPNYEVRKHFLSEAFTEILHIVKKFEYQHLERLRMALDDNNPKEFYTLLDNFFRSVPYTAFKGKSDITNVEAFYSAVLTFALQFLPTVYRVQAEDATSDGSVDLVIETPTRIFLVEHKVLARDEANANARQVQLEKKAKEALEQIDEKIYAAKFSIKAGLPITKVGVCFDAQTRSIGHVEVKGL